MRNLDTSRTGYLQGRNVFLSASVPVRPGFLRVPDAAFIIEQAVVAAARAVFAEGGRLVFGGHPSISPLVASVAAEYRPPGQSEDPDVVIYQSRAYAAVVPDETWDMVRYGYARLRWTEAVDGEKFVPGAPGPQCLKSLEAMRMAMISETKPAAMLAIGGMEGVIDEAKLFQKHAPGKPIYTALETGGAAAQLVGRSDVHVRCLESAWGYIAESASDDSRAVLIPPYPAIMQWLVRSLL